MSPPIVITVPVFNRPATLRLALGGWSQVRGIENARMEFICEPVCEEAIEECRAFEHCERAVFINPERLGHAANVYRGMATAFQLTDYAIQALDDYFPATDLLEMHTWHRMRYGGDESVLCMRSGTDRKHAGGLAAIWRTQLVGALNGFHRHKWEKIAAHWHQATDEGWWWWVDETWCVGGPHLDVLAPALSRADDLAVSITPPGLFAADPPRQDYYEVTGAVERGFTRRTYRVPKEPLFYCPRCRKRVPIAEIRRHD